MKQGIFNNRWTQAVAALGLVFAGCKGSNSEPDAYGNFEAQEVVVSAEATGKLVQFSVQEGQTLNEAQVVGAIDAGNLELQKQQVQASLDALYEKEADANPQVAVLNQQITMAREQSRTAQEQTAVTRQQIANLERERTRTKNLIAVNAATQKQYDDIQGQIDVLERQLDVQRQQVNTQNQQVAVLQRQIEATKSTVATQNRSILSETEPINRRIALLDDQIAKTTIKNPTMGTVLAKYSSAGEIVNYGKPLYKLADLSSLDLRAYISGDQLASVKIGKQATVSIEGPNGQPITLKGTVSWVSDKAEFTPKTIQTKQERASQVYAVKIKVPNSKGELKIGMPADVKF